MLGIIAALESEASTLGPAVRRRDGLSSLGEAALLAVSGMGSIRAAMAARSLVGAGAAGLMSFGLAGGLDPSLRAGCLVLPGEVISREGARFLTADGWRERLHRLIAKQRPVVAGKLLTNARAHRGDRGQSQCLSRNRRRGGGHGKSGRRGSGRRSQPAVCRRACDRGYSHGCAAASGGGGKQRRTTERPTPHRRTRCGASRRLRVDPSGAAPSSGDSFVGRRRSRRSVDAAGRGRSRRMNRSGALSSGRQMR